MMNKKELLEQIEKNVRTCQKCRLCKTAKNAVPGEGNIDSQVVFIGEAPGEKEDLTGRPFVGRAGKLLEQLLAQIGMNRTDVWIGNVIKHRPPENRDPFPDEIEACLPYLTMQLKIINPKVVVTLGRFAMGYFYKEGKISRDHGSAIRLKDYVVFPLYHPAAALRNPEMDRALKEDFLKIPDVVKNAENNVKINGLQTSTPARDDGQLGLF